MRCGSGQQSRRHGLGSVVAVVAALLLLVVSVSSLTLAGGAAADSSTPSAGQVASAKAHVGTVASRVGVMQAELVAGQARLQTLGLSVDAASEAYNGAMYHLQQAQAAAGLAQRAAGSAGVALTQARLDVGRLAAAAYRSGGADFGLGALVTADSPQNALSAVSMLDVLANRSSGIMDRMKAAQVVSGVLNDQASGALDAVTRAAQAATAAKAAVEAKVAQQGVQVAGINSQVAQLTRQLTAATAQSASLSVARQAGLARAAAAAAAAQAAAARRHVYHRPSGGGGGSGGGGSGGGGGGGSGGGGGTTTGAAAAIAFAEAQIGDPYQWGGAGPNTWDCSGLTMRAWAAGGVALPHWAAGQWALSTPVSASQARPGDLVFFAYDPNDWQTIHHVALYLGGGMMLEAPYTGAFVRISPVSTDPDLFGYARP